MKALKACITALTLGLAALSGGCGDSGTDGTSTGAGASSTSAGGGGTGGAATGGGGETTGGGGTASASGGAGGGAMKTPAVETVVDFDPSMGELPEGLVVVGANARVGFAPTGGVVSVPLAGGAATAFASLPPPPPNTSLMTGLTVDTAGALYGALVSFTDAVQPGIYKAPAAGGAATLFASDPSMTFPNGFAWTDDGTLFVADSAFGVFKVAPDGTTTPWLQNDLLNGDPTACGGAASDLSIGANGIVRQGKTMFVSSTNQGVLIKVPIADDGSAGPISVVAGPDCSISGIDGIALDDDGTIIGAINKQNKLVRIDAAGGITTLVDGGKLDFPASLAFAGTGADRALYVTSFAYLSATTGGMPHPSLLRVRFTP